MIVSSCLHGPDDICFILGSGKTFTMKPLPIRAVEDLMRLLRQPVYSNQRFKLWLSYFEIYGGKLFDLLSERKLVSFLFPFLFNVIFVESFHVFFFLLACSRLLAYNCYFDDSLL